MDLSSAIAIDTNTVQAREPDQHETTETSHAARLQRDQRKMTLSSYEVRPQRDLDLGVRHAESVKHSLRDQHETTDTSHASRLQRDLTFLLQEEQVNLVQITTACYREPPTLLLQIWSDSHHELHDDVKHAIIEGVSGAVARDCYADFQLIHFLDHPEFHQGILHGFKELWSSLRFSVGNTTLWIDSSKGKEYNCTQQEKEYLLIHCLDRSSVPVRIGNQQKHLAIWLSPKAKQIMHRAHQFELAVISASSQHINKK